MQVLIVTGGSTSGTTLLDSSGIFGTSFLDSSELLVYGADSWTEIESLKLPLFIRASFLINIKNSVFPGPGQVKVR